MFPFLTFVTTTKPNFAQTCMGNYCTFLECGKAMERKSCVRSREAKEVFFSGSTEEKDVFYHQVQDITVAVMERFYVCSWPW